MVTLIRHLTGGDGYKQLVTFIEKEQEKFDKIYIAGDYWQPYIYTLFYLKYNPRKYQEESSDHGHFGKYYFGQTSWDEAGKSFYKTKVALDRFLESDNNLIVVSPDKTLDLPVFKDIYSINGERVFVIYRT